MTRTLTATVDGSVYPVDLALVTAAQVLRLRRELGVDLAPVAADPSTADLLDVAGIVAVSIEQRVAPTDFLRVAERITAGSSFSVSYDDGEPEAEIPAPIPEPILPPDQAAAVRAMVHAELAKATAHGSTPS